MIDAQWERQLQQQLLAYRRQDFKEQYVNSYRLVCDGLVIDQTPARLGREFSIMLLSFFRDTIIKSFNPDWKFNGFESGRKWRKWQNKRLGCRLSRRLVIIDPGEYVPLCDYWKNGEGL